MTVTNTPRLGLKRWGAGSDPDPRTDHVNNVDKLESLAAIDLQGLKTARPAAAIRGRYYTATDEGIVYRDDGSAWYQVGAYDLATRGRGRIDILQPVGNMPASGYVTAETTMYELVTFCPAARRAKVTFQVGLVDANATGDTAGHGAKAAAIVRLRRVLNTGGTPVLSGGVFASKRVTVFDDDSNLASGVTLHGYFDTTGISAFISMRIGVTLESTTTAGVRFLDTDSVGFLLAEDDGD